MTTSPASPVSFFAPDSFWNTPIPADAATDPSSTRWIELMAATQPGRGLHVNLHDWTIPVFLADASTPRHRLRPKLLRCHLSQGHVKASQHRLTPDHPLGLHASVRGIEIPIPDHAAPDAKQDAHMAIIDVDARRVYDLWQCRREPDGTWHTNAAIAYDLDGPGVFRPEDLEGIANDESVHFYGPCRASGVPLLGGLIMRHEIEAGHIAHKLAFACPVPGLQRHAYPPAVWTDGWLPGGVPEGCVLQLAPDLDLSRFALSPAARTVARALQDYGATLVDYAGGVTLYGESLEPHASAGQTWNGTLEESGLFAIGLEHYRVLETGPLRPLGSHPVFHQGMARLFYEHVENHGAHTLNEMEPWRTPLQ